MRHLEGQLAQMREERDRLEREAKEVQEGREEENRIIQEVNKKFNNSVSSSSHVPG